MIQFIAGAPQRNVLGITIDGGGAPPPLGVAGFLQVPISCTILSWTILAQPAGTISIDIWRSTFAAFPPAIGDSITGGNPVLIGAPGGVSATDSALAGWTVQLVAGDCLMFNLAAVVLITRAQLQLLVR